MNLNKSILLIQIIILLNTTLFSNEQININFKNLKIMEFINVTSKIINKDILVENKIEGKVNFISRGSITKDKVLNILSYILNDKGYEIIKSNDILRIIKIKDIKKENKRLVQKVVDVIYLKNAQSKNIIKIINDIISKKKYKNNENRLLISSDDESNSIILMGDKKQITFFINLIKKLDIKREQVYVKARIIEVNERKSHNIGVKYGLAGGTLGSDELFTFAVNAGGDVMTSGMFSIKNLQKSLALGATINLLKNNQAIDIVSEPSLLCINNKESSIYVGETKSFQTGATTTALDFDKTNVTFKREDIGLTLKVKPRISSSNKVNLNIGVILEDAKELKDGQINPDTSKKQISTTAIVNNGESVILGGYIKNIKDHIQDNVPFFEDIPILGELFKNSKEVNSKINLVIIITPYIIYSNQSLTSIRDQLAVLKALEEEYTKNFLLKLEERKIKMQKDNININNKTLHQQRLNEIFGI